MKVTNEDVMFDVIASNGSLLAVEIHAKTETGVKYIKALDKKLTLAMNDDNAWEIDALV
jgi:hypothetical protein